MFHVNPTLKLDLSLSGQLGHGPGGGADVERGRETGQLAPPPGGEREQEPAVGDRLVSGHADCPRYRPGRSNGDPERPHASLTGSNSRETRAVAAVSARFSATVRWAVPRPPSTECPIWRSSMLTSPSARAAVREASAPGRSGM